MASWVLGVDLGTTSTLAAVWIDGEPEPRLVGLGEDGPAMSSAVVVEEAGDGVRIHVGDVAARCSRRASDHLLANPRTHLGDDALHIGERSVAIVDLISAQLRHVIARATAATGGDAPRSVVLTHPFGWDDLRRERLEAAARQAYAGPVVFVAEPVAAATAYAGPARTLCVVDVGAGSTDVALVDRGAGAPRVLAAGATASGGNRVDAALIRHMLDELRAGGRADLADDLVAERSGPAMLGLREGVRQARLALAAGGPTVVPVTVDGDDGSATVEIGAERVERLAGALADLAAHEVRSVTERSGLSLAEVGAVVAVGGASRLPGLRDRLSAALGRDVDTLPEPATAVVFGALAHAAAHGGDAATPPASPPMEPAESAQPVESEAVSADAHPTGGRRRSHTVPLVAAALALVAVAVLALMRPWERPNAPSARPPAAGSVTPMPADTPDPPTAQELADRARLSALVSRDEKDCEFDDQPGPGGELVQMTCPNAVQLGDGSGWVTYTLFADEAQAAAQLLDLGVDDSRQCPSPGVGPYDIEGRRGRVACTANNSAVFWTEAGTPVVAGYAAPGVSLGDLYSFWVGHNRL
ncbi:Hsp70 family protein [Mariniluteicoccus flavus]